MAATSLHIAHYAVLGPLAATPAATVILILEKNFPDGDGFQIKMLASSLQMIMLEGNLKRDSYLDSSNWGRARWNKIDQDKLTPKEMTIFGGHLKQRRKYAD